MHNHCRDCQKQTRRKWYLKNKESELKKQKKYSLTEQAKVIRKKKYEKNREKILEKNRIRRKTPHARKLANIARNKKYHNDKSFKISVNLRSRIRKALKGISKSKSTQELIGCSFEELKIYLESKFTDGMSWDNYNYFGWHVDHIIPCDFFDLSSDIEQAKCFHYTNLQPLWMKDNISKNNKVIFKDGNV